RLLSARPSRSTDRAPASDPPTRRGNGEIHGFREPLLARDLVPLSGGSPMAARAYWQGQIRLALVSIPVEIYPATKSGAAIQFRQIHEPSGKRIHYEKVVPGVGPVDRDEIVKGYEIAKGNYVLLDEDEIEAVRIE